MDLGEQVSHIINSKKKDAFLRNFHYAEAESEFQIMERLEKEGSEEWFAHYVQGVEHWNAAKAYEKMLASSSKRAEQFLGSYSNRGALQRAYVDAQRKRADIMRQIFKNMPVQKYVH